MELLLINSAEPTVRDFIDPLELIALLNDVNYISIEYTELRDINPFHFGGVIISGSPMGDDIVEHHRPYFEWLKKYLKPVFGICAGHHIIGTMYGAELYRSKEIEKGSIEIEIIKPCAVFEGYPQTFKGEAMHNDSIAVPDGFELIATTQTCHNEAMKKCDRHWYTFQFHPEQGNKKMITNFIQLVKTISNAT